MYLCRAAWQKLGPWAQKSATTLSKNVVPVRSLSYGPLRSSGQNIGLAVFCGGSLTAAIFYAYKTVVSDSERFNKRVSELNTRSKLELEPKQWPAKGEDEESEPAAEEDGGKAEALVAEVAAGETSAETPAAEQAEEGAGAAQAEVPEEPHSRAAPVPAESNVAVSDLLSSMKAMAGSTAEIAAASVGERRMVLPVNVLEEKPQVVDPEKVELSPPQSRASVAEGPQGSPEGVSEEDREAPSLGELDVVMLDGAATGDEKEALAQAKEDSEEEPEPAAEQMEAAEAEPAATVLESQLDHEKQTTAVEEAQEEAQEEAHEEAMEEEAEPPEQQRTAAEEAVEQSVEVSDADADAGVGCLVAGDAEEVAPAGEDAKMDAASEEVTASPAGTEVLDVEAKTTVDPEAPSEEYRMDQMKELGDAAPQEEATQATELEKSTAEIPSEAEKETARAEKTVKTGCRPM